MYTYFCFKQRLLSGRCFHSLFSRVSTRNVTRSLPDTTHIGYNYRSCSFRSTVKKITLNAVCEEGDQCGDSSALCDGGVCRCHEGFFDRLGTCSKNRWFGGSVCMDARITPTNLWTHTRTYASTQALTHTHKSSYDVGTSRYKSWVGMRIWGFWDYLKGDVFRHRAGRKSYREKIKLSKRWQPPNQLTRCQHIYTDRCRGQIECSVSGVWHLSRQKHRMQKWNMPVRTRLLREVKCMSWVQKVFDLNRR